MINKVNLDSPAALYKAEIMKIASATKARLKDNEFLACNLVSANNLPVSKIQVLSDELLWFDGEFQGGMNTRVVLHYTQAILQFYRVTLDESTEESRPLIGFQVEEV